MPEGHIESNLPIDQPLQLPAPANHKIDVPVSDVAGAAIWEGTLETAGKRPKPVKGAPPVKATVETKAITPLKAVKGASLLDKYASSPGLQIAATAVAVAAVEKLSPKQHEVVEKAIELREKAQSGRGNIGHLAIAWNRLSPEDQVKFVKSKTSSLRRVAKNVGRLTNITATWKILKYGSPVIGQFMIAREIYGAARNRLPYPDFLRAIKDFDPELVLELVQLGVLDCHEEAAQLIDSTSQGEARIKSAVLSGVSFIAGPIAPVAGAEAAWFSSKSRRISGMPAVREMVRESLPTPPEEPGIVGTSISGVTESVRDLVHKATGKNDGRQQAAA